MADRLAADDPRIVAGRARLKACRQDVGTCDADLMSDLVNPIAEGNPARPNTSRACRIVRPANSLMISADGGSDPFVGWDLPGHGFGGCV